MPAPKGHIKWGGKKNGTKNKKTLEREMALKVYQQAIMNDLKDFIESQFLMAKGMTVMFQRRKVKDKKGEYHRTGEFQRVRNELEIERLLNSDCNGDDWYYITTKDPNVKALEDVFCRIFGKPEQSIKHSGDELNPIRERIEFAYLVKKANEQKGTGKNNNQ